MGGGALDRLTRPCDPDQPRGPNAIQVHVLEAKTQLSRLLDRNAAGENVVIARAGRPPAHPVAVSKPAPARPLAMVCIRDWIAADVDAPLDEAFIEDDDERG